MVGNVIKEVFFFLAMAILGVVLYTQLLEYPDGALWRMSEAVQTPIAFYYHQYCYTPNMHQTDETDRVLGLTPIWNLHNTPSNIENKDSVSYPAGNSYYTTDWF